MFYFGGSGRNGQTAFKMRTALRYPFRVPVDDGELLLERANHAIDVDATCVACRICFGMFVAAH